MSRVHRWVLRVRAAAGLLALLLVAPAVAEAQPRRDGTRVERRASRTSRRAARKRKRRARRRARAVRRGARRRARAVRRGARRRARASTRQGRGRASTRNERVDTQSQRSPASRPDSAEAGPAAAPSREETELPPVEAMSSPDGEDVGAQTEVVEEGGRRVTVIRFSGLDISGRLRSPQVIYFLSRVRAEFERPRLPHRSFLPELNRSADEDR